MTATTAPAIGFQFTTRRDLTVETWTVTRVTPRTWGTFVEFTTPSRNAFGDVHTSYSGMSLQNFNRMIASAR